MENVSIVYPRSLYEEVESYVKDVDLGIFDSAEYRKSVFNLMYLCTSHLLRWRDVNAELPPHFQEVLLTLLLPDGTEAICSGFRDAVCWHHRYTHTDGVEVTGWRPIHVEL